jgi:hypothetical protein
VSNPIKSLRSISFSSEGRSGILPLVSAKMALLP